MASIVLGKVGITPKGEYNAEAEYNYLDLVTSDGSSYIALEAGSGKALDNGEYWQLVAEKGKDGTEMAVNATMYNTPWDCIVSNPDKEVLLCVGDSLTALDEGYVFYLQDLIRKSSGNDGIVINRHAFSGYRVYDMYPTYEPYLGAEHQYLYPDARVITILLGTNDTKTIEDNTWCSPGLLKAYYIFTIEWFKANRPNCEIRILQIPWMWPDTPDPTFANYEQRETNGREIARCIVGLARRYGMPYPPDLYAATVEKRDLFKSIDGLHFTSKGFKHIAPIFANLLKQKPTYSADRDYLTGKEYKLSGGTIYLGFEDWVGDASPRKLTNGLFSTLLNEADTGSPMIRYSYSNNGGFNSTLNVTFEVDFGEEVVINDVCSYHGNGTFRQYSPTEITYYTWSGSEYLLVGKLIGSDESRKYNFPYELSVFLPDKPFKSQGLKIVFSKTFRENSSEDMLLLGEIAATKLDNYSGEIMGYGEMESET